jgi:hypothetical protein
MLFPYFWAYKNGVKHMNIDQCSTGGLRSLHDGVCTALAEDDALPKGKKAFGVRESQDWREWADAIEGELAKRGKPVPALDW